MTNQDIENLTKQPPAKTCFRIDFDEAIVVPGFVNDTYFLIVSGVKPWVTMEVSLQPLIYIEKPEYWQIEVVGCQNGLGLPTIAPYTVAIEVSRTIGHKGIEVVGATKTKRIKVSG